jgi:hypothetical protein
MKVHTEDSAYDCRLIFVDDEPAVFRNAIAIWAESSTGGFPVLDGGNLAVYPSGSEQFYLVLGHNGKNLNHNLGADVAFVAHPEILLMEISEAVVRLEPLKVFEQIGRLAVKTAELAEQHLLVNAKFDFCLENGEIRTFHSVLESAHNVNEDVKVPVEIELVQLCKTCQLFLLTVGLL